MAKRLIDWSLEGSILTMGKYIDSETPAEKLVDFDMEKLFPFKGATEVQQFIFTYGLKQKLADCGSAEKDPRAKALLAEEKFQDFLDGKLTAVRSNATGAKENKRIVETLREKSKVVSMEGLIAKQMMFPESFTEENQEKLDEFFKIKFDFEREQKEKAEK